MLTQTAKILKRSIVLIHVQYSWPPEGVEKISIFCTDYNLQKMDIEIVGNSFVTNISILFCKLGQFIAIITRAMTSSPFYLFIEKYLLSSTKCFVVMIESFQERFLVYESETTPLFFLQHKNQSLWLTMNISHVYAVNTQFYIVPSDLVQTT